MKGEYGGVYLAEYDYLNGLFMIVDKENVCRFVYDNNLFDSLLKVRLKAFEIFGDEIDFALSVMERDENNDIKSIVVAVIDIFITPRMAREQLRKLREWFDKGYNKLSELVTFAIVSENTAEE